MKTRFFFAILCALALASAAIAQDTSPAAGPGDAPERGRGGWENRGGMGMGRGLMGTVTEAAADHYTIKTETGEVYVVRFSANTRILKQAAQRPQPGSEGQGGYQRNPPQPLKASDIKVGDAVVAMGEVDTGSKSVGAVMVLQVDPERAKQLREMEASFGKTWLMGKVTGVEGVKVTLRGTVDDAAHSFVADENTTFRKRRDPITLADIQPGDMIRVEGETKDGAFVAARVMVMGMRPGGPPSLPRNGQPAAPPH